MKKIAVTGSLAFDHIMDFPATYEENIMPDKLKTLSLSFLVDNFNKNFGGVGGNITYNLRLLKQEVCLLGSAGKKDFHQYKKHLKKSGVDISLINFIEDEFTANMFILTDKNNMIPYLYDPAQNIPFINEEDLKNGLDGSEILIGNDYEMALIEKKTNFSKKQILKKVKILITTLGGKGSLIETSGKKIHIGIVNPNKIVDPTGAGDAYIAGFLSGYINNLSLRTCGRMGATLATYAIENYGTQKHKFTLRQFKGHFKKAFGKNLPLPF